MNEEISGFKPGRYILEKTGNTKKTIKVQFANHGPLCCGVLIKVVQTEEEFNLETAKKEGWIVLENKDAGPHELIFIALVQDWCGAHVSFPDGNFKDRESFFESLFRFLTFIKVNGCRKLDEV
jgi:hypothetical protein